jgi:hypothetical protein
MTFSAGDQAAASNGLDRSLELYRDLSVALGGRIAQLKAGTDGDPVCGRSDRALNAHRKALQAVLDIEASLVKRSGAGAGGAGAELDLDGSRAEILARLAAWNATA